MTKRTFNTPQLWTEEELERDRLFSESRFVDSLLRTGANSYATYFSKLLPETEKLFEHTSDLVNLSNEMSDLSTMEREALRFVCSPPFSEDNQKTIVRSRSCIQGCSSDQALLEATFSLLDPFRFPWLAQNRCASLEERKKAIEWTTSLWAIQKSQTGNRTLSCTSQESSVKALLINEGFHLDNSRSDVVLIDDIERLTFRNENVVFGKKCDVPLRLPDGRLMLIECKVSNSAVNSTKRLIREVCGKAPFWRNAFGEHVVISVVIDGVFSKKNLIEAQNEHGIHLFWGFRLEDLSSFLNAPS